MSESVLLPALCIAGLVLLFGGIFVGLEAKKWKGACVYASFLGLVLLCAAAFYDGLANRSPPSLFGGILLGLILAFLVLTLPALRARKKGP